ncbi:MAG TPA: GlsB/YeaQ/YmgE family stress response membrane protein [Candidatus Acidoferrum sp.]|nr:GlsB/YeaQ/YmgE family stress response membrane protein [Candidatus Acidoferrum sp.]
MFAALQLTVLQGGSIVVHWWPRGLFAWLLLGLIAGWLAGKLARGRGYGCITDIILGLIGAVIGGWIFTKLGVFGGGFLYSLAAATLGAVILVAIVHLFTGGPRD